MLSFFLIVVAFMAICFLFCYGLAWTNRTYADLVERVGAILNNARGIQSLIAQQNSNVSAWLLTSDIAYKDDQQRINEEIHALIEETGRLITQEDDKRNLDHLLTYNRSYVEILDRVYATADADRETAVREVKTKVIPFGEVMIDLSRQIADSQERYIREEIGRINAFAGALKIVSIAAAVAVPGFALLFSLVMSRRISEPLVALAEGARRMSSGDLSMRDIVVSARDETGDLAQAFNRMKAELGGLARKVAASAGQVSVSAREFTESAAQTAKATESIAHAMQKTSEGTDRQLRLVRESEQAANGMAGEIRNMAESASNTALLSGRTAEKASAGYAQLQEAVGQMHRIGGTMEHLSGVMDRMKERSDRVGRFVALISGISRQTRILSLNAAIEAARAKESGRGFGVVAGEVRELAAQTEDAARQAAELVGRLQEDTEQVYRIVGEGARDVAEGIRSVNAAGAMFEEIKACTEEVAERIGGISAASLDLSRRMSRMADAMGEIREVSETVAEDTLNVQAAVEEQLAAMQEISSTAAVLSDMSAELYDATRQFKFESGITETVEAPERSARGDESARAESSARAAAAAYPAHPVRSGRVKAAGHPAHAVCSGRAKAAGHPAQAVSSGRAKAAGHPAHATRAGSAEEMVVEDGNLY